MNVERIPDRVTIQTDGRLAVLRKIAEGRWTGRDLEVITLPGRGEMRVAVSGGATGIQRIWLRWNGRADPDVRFLGDHWERGYGDLEWRGHAPDRVMPWYFLSFDGTRTDGHGVKTGANSLCFWQADPNGVSLWLDVRCGGRGVVLGGRRLEAAAIVFREGRIGETPFEAQRKLCGLLCRRSLTPALPVYGANNWYYTYNTYSHSSHAEIVRDAKIVSDLSPSTRNRPYMVIDMGWHILLYGGPWLPRPIGLPDMARLAKEIRHAGARPGIWIRPLLTSERLPKSWFLPNSRFEPRSPDGQAGVLDPTVPEALAQVTADIRRLREWDYELIKHDFSTYDLLGRWGFDMGAQVTTDGWGFADSGKTTAEAILELYRAIRKAAGDAVLIGCNTIGHLAAGLVELQRTGDDTSGLIWERTRKMGINTLAFRAAQHGAFFAADADCVALTKRIPWAFNRQWLDLLARSGTPLFVSASPDALGPDQKKALKQAFAVAACPQPLAEPLDWFQTTCPARWRLQGQERRFDWYGLGGVNPLPAFPLPTE